MGQYGLSEVKIRRLEVPNLVTFIPGNVNVSTWGDRTLLEEILMSSELTSIPNYCFYQHTVLSKIEGIDWSKITSISPQAFYGCTALEIEELNLPSLTSLGQNAFYNVPITKITNLGSISSFPAAGTGTATFGSRSILKEIVIPTSITSIVDNCFYNYSALETCTFHDGITYIGSQAFRGCSSLYIEDLNLPSLISLVAQAFRGVKFGNISSLGNITTINDAAFREGKVTKTIVLPSTLTTIGANAFTYTTIGSMVIEATTPPTLGANAFLNANAFPIYVPDESVEAYKTATNWTEYADRIKSIYFYLGYLEFESATFEAKCVSLYGSDGKVTIEQAAAVTSIAEGAFRAVGSGKFHELRHFTNLTSLGANSFRSSAVTHISLPASITNLGWGAFFQCNSLIAVKIYATTPPTLAASVFAENASGRKIYVPDASLDAYKTASGWVDYADYIFPLSEYTE